MRVQGLVLLAVGLASAARPAKHRRRDVGEELAANKYILEVAQDQLEAVSAHFTAKEGAKVLKKYNSDVFTGLQIQSKVDNIDSLVSISTVSAAWRSRRYSVPKTNATLSFSDDIAAQNYSVHHATGVDKLHNAGITGKGALVAIVDTGVDYTHPAFGGCFGGDGCKIVSGYDFGGDIYDPYTPDSDPMDNYGHGTHVAGIVAGNDRWFKGVAPDANLLVYKVATEDGGIDDAWIMEAFVAAYEAGADVITCSIGGPDGWSDGAWQLVANRLADLGVIITIAAGNDGESGPFWGSSGASAEGAISVAATDVSTIAASPFTLTVEQDGVKNSTTIAFTRGVYVAPWADEPFPWDITDVEIVLLSTDPAPPDEACQELPAGTPDLSGKIVLIRGEGCYWGDVQRYLEPYNPGYILFYDTEYIWTQPHSQTESPSMGGIEAKAAAGIIEAIKGGARVFGSFNAEYAKTNWVNAETLSGGVAAYFTSWATLWDLQIKPDVAAPGSQILSAKWKGTDGEPNGYIVMSGTSMATPYVAGVAALYVSKYGGRSVHGTQFAKQVRDRILSSGNTLPWHVDEFDDPPQPNGFFAPVHQVGTGQIDALKLLTYNTTLAFEKMVLNDTHHFSRYHSIDVTNNHPFPVRYTFHLEAAGGFEAMGPQRIYYGWEVTPVSIVPNVTMPSGAQTLQPGQTKTFKINFEPVQNLDGSKLPCYSGKIIVTSSAGESLGVPYLGAAFDLGQEMSEMFTDGYPLQSMPNTNQNIDAHHTYTMNTSTLDFPVVYAQLRWGTRQLRWDLFEPSWKERDWSWPLVPGQNGYIGAATFDELVFWQSSFGDASDPVAAFPATLFRNGLAFPEMAFAWLGQLANGSQIASGNYMMRFAALRPFGTPSHGDNWDVWRTPVITIT
ncbi:subtilisin-like protein [Thozetella sp. PMI_491]|nr:subtilisin-like protein [Thozetella sp. PMI_491]